MKKAQPLIIFIGIYAALYLVLWNFFPKFHGMITFLFVALLLDFYLWSSVWPYLVKKRVIIRSPITALYWTPALLFVVLIFIGLVHSFLEWNLFLRTQLLSLLMITLFAKTIPLLFLIVTDLIHLLRLAFVRLVFRMEAMGSHRKRTLPTIGWVAGGFIWLVLFLGITFWAFDYRINTIKVPLQNLPTAFIGYRIVHLSDIHLGSWTCKSELQEAVEYVNALKPDVIVFTGDMFNYATSDGFGFEAILNHLSAKDGVYAVLGNHDYGDYVRWPDANAKQTNMLQLTEWYHHLGWRVLRNESVVLKHGGDSIALIGVENWGAERRFQQYADMPKALKGVSEVPVKILLSHDPSHWDSIVSKKYPEIGLTLSGHTHGGQLGIETTWFQWSPVAWFYKHWGGLYENLTPNKTTNQFLYVNRGLGTVGYSGRVGINPEISLIILVQKAQPNSLNGSSQ